MDFADLNDEVGADDWTIPRNEITRRKLVKQTKRHKIYKADWFGDVLLYEPICKPDIAKRRRGREVPQLIPLDCPKRPRSIELSDQEDLAIRLNELCLRLEGQHDKRCELVSSIDSNQTTDSAYSSASTTPQHHTKHNFSHEFAFPAQLSPSALSTSSSETRWPLFDDEQSPSRQLPRVKQSTPGSCNSAPTVSPAVVLNKQSFLFDQDFRNDNSCEIAHCNANGFACSHCSNFQAIRPNGNWFELNELRLIAHENFMLFMGASLNESALTTGRGLEQTAALVMQMSHPKSVSLFDLLHASARNLSPSSPFERFFTFDQRFRPQQPLNIETKLNICQQVTDGMTYLHDKNIVHGRLTSVNIYLEPNQRVKISLIDEDERPIASVEGNFPIAADASDDLDVIEMHSSLVGGEYLTDEALDRSPTVGNQTRGCSISESDNVAFNLSTLTYLSPELVKTIKLTPSGGCGNIGNGNNCENSMPIVQLDTNLLTKEADVFSFGTLLFELFEERFPFSSPNASDSLELNMQSAAMTSDLKTSAGPRLNSSCTKLLNSLCLESSPTTTTILTRSNGSPITGPLLRHNPMPRSQSGGKMETKANWDGNINASASELIFQIGSGQIAERNFDADRYPTLVDHIIKACWSYAPNERPRFKQFKFAK